MAMIVSLTALIAAAALSAGTEADAEPLDDLRVLSDITAMAEGDAIAEPDWSTFQGYAAPDADAVGPDERGYRHGRRHRRGRQDGYGHGGQYAANRRADGGVYGPSKDRLRTQGRRFGLNSALGGNGFVDMPGPSGAGGRIAADALSADAGVFGDGIDDDAAQDGSAAPLATVATVATAPSHGTARDTEAGTAPALRLSFAKSAAPAELAEETDAIATPLPASFLLFASGIGLMGLSRRRAA